MREAEKGSNHAMDEEEQFDAQSRRENADGKYEAEVLVFALGESNVPLFGPTDDVRDRRADHLGVGDQWPILRIQRYLAARDQHRNHHRDVPHGVLDSEHAEPDSEAMQLKLDELIRATTGAQNALLDLEELEEAELDAIRDEYERTARLARGELRNVKSEKKAARLDQH
jgi:hypothetical protein